MNDDATVHGLLCTSRTTLVRPPDEDKMVRCILFPPDQGNPEWLWLPSCSTPSGFPDSVNCENIIGNNEKIIYARVPDHPSKFDQVRKGLTIWWPRPHSGLPNNLSVRSATRQNDFATKGAVVAGRIGDLDMDDFRVIVDYLRRLRKGLLPFDSFGPLNRQEEGPFV